MNAECHNTIHMNHLKSGYALRVRSNSVRQYVNYHLQVNNALRARFNNVREYVNYHLRYHHWTIDGSCGDMSLQCCISSNLYLRNMVSMQNQCLSLTWLVYVLDLCMCESIIYTLSYKEERYIRYTHYATADYDTSNSDGIVTSVRPEFDFHDAHCRVFVV